MSRRLLLASVLVLLGCAVEARATETASRALTEAVNAALSLNADASRVELVERCLRLAAEARADEELGLEAGTWWKLGLVYGVVAERVHADDREHLPTLDGEPALDAHAAYRRAFELTAGSVDPMTMLPVGTHADVVTRAAAEHFESGRFDLALACFQAAEEVQVWFDERAERPVPRKQEARDELSFFIGVSAYMAGQTEVALAALSPLVERGGAPAPAYQVVFEIENATDPSHAREVLRRGREHHPDDVDLLFLDINAGLAAQEYDRIVPSIEHALELEPQNAPLHATLGSVCEALSGQAAVGGNTEEASRLFARADGAYRAALEIDSDLVDALYSLATLHYNRAAALTNTLAALEDDTSPEGLARSDALREEILAAFDVALPYFVRCETLAPNDPSVLQALGEIYARRGDHELANRCSDRLARVRAGETFEHGLFGPDADSTDEE